MLRPDQKRGGHLWYVVVTHAGQERLAKYHLERQRFETYLPMRAPMVAARKRDGSTPEPRPMFPRYLFVAVDLATPGWRSIYSTIGVHSVICSGVGEQARPIAAPNGLIEQLQAREVNGLVVLPPRSKDRPCPHAKGDRVKVVGRTTDYDGVFLERVDATRAALLVSLLGRDSRQVVPLSVLKAPSVR